MADVGREFVGEKPSKVEPLHVTATLSEGLVMTEPPILDGIVAAVYAVRERLLPPAHPGEIVPIEIPMARSDCGRVWMCSSGYCQEIAHEVRAKRRRPPLIEYARLGKGSIKSIAVTGGEDKACQAEYSYSHLLDHTIEWWCLGDREMLARMLCEVTSLGKHRGSGKGCVRSWQVEPCETWGDGFPVLRDGEPMRPLPLDYPDLVDPFLAYHTIAPPYWMHALEEECAIPRPL